MAKIGFQTKQSFRQIKRDQINNAQKQLDNNNINKPGNTNTNTNTNTNNANTNTNNANTNTNNANTNTNNANTNTNNANTNTNNANTNTNNAKTRIRASSDNPWRNELKASTQKDPKNPPGSQNGFEFRQLLKNAADWWDKRVADVNKIIEQGEKNIESGGADDFL